MDITGSLIRRLRMERRLSQKSLCKGVCAVSYLSKIEKGTANPGEEIIRLLFGALGAILFRLAAGALGEALPYQTVPLILGSVGLLSVYVFIFRNKRHIRPIYDKDV
jgi:transcriptional regulator with XRE-family HTH domain